MFKVIPTPKEQEKIDDFYRSKTPKYAGAIGGRYDIILTPYKDKVEYKVFDCIDKDYVISTCSDLEIDFSPNEQKLFNDWISNKTNVMEPGRLSYGVKFTSLGVIYYINDNLLKDSINLTDFESW